MFLLRVLECCFLSMVGVLRLLILLRLLLRHFLLVGPLLLRAGRVLFHGDPGVD